MFYYRTFLSTQVMCNIKILHRTVAHMFLRCALKIFYETVVVFSGICCSNGANGACYVFFISILFFGERDCLIFHKTFDL